MSQTPWYMNEIQIASSVEETERQVCASLKKKGYKLLKREAEKRNPDLIHLIFSKEKDTE